LIKFGLDIMPRDATTKAGGKCKTTEMATAGNLHLDFGSKAMINEPLELGM
jgi:hypothetical protein